MVKIVGGRLPIW